jgi:hypothetical protein
MSKLGSWSRSGWIVVGIVLALLLVPTGVAVALTFTGIRGTSGQDANVSNDGQLLATEAQPSEFVQYEVDFPPGGACENVLTIPSGKALIVRRINMVAFSVDTSSNAPGDFGEFLAGPGATSGCSGSGGIDFADVAFGVSNDFNISVPLDPGFAIKSGDILFASYGTGKGGGTSTARAHIYGYLVPTTDVPADG